MRFLAVLIGGIAAALGVTPAGHAQEVFPSKTITVTVGFPPGGNTDVIARIVAERMEGILGQRIVIDNRAGAGSTLAAAHVARAAPDGYTLLTGSPSTNAIAPNLYTNLPYDSLKALAPVALLVNGPAVLVVHPSTPVSTVQELVALYKREPGKHNFATGGNGTHAHLITEWLMEASGTSIVHVPFRGGGPALQAVLAGEPSMIIDNLPTALPHIQAGRVKALAVFSAKRVSVLPDVPTMVEAGYQDMVTGSWTAFYAPAGTPPEVIAKLNAAAVAAVRDPQVVEKLTKLSAVPVGPTPAELDALTRLEYERWGALIRQRKVTVN
ncbi:MAG: tripartite tricarboxylate transporter substrate binding protein [Alphaproteobacteria bacterium]|nr:tripartite tricarboxylate transporter substrate binding protein [Alphaproteobacteria bacterium]